MDFIFLNRTEKKYQTFTGDNERRDHIVKVTRELQSAYPYVEIYYIPSSIPPKEELGSDWVQNQDIYELAVLNFNQLGGKILSAWNPNR